MAGDRTKLTYDEILLSKEFYAYVAEPTSEIREYWDKILAEDISVRIEFDKALKLNKLLSSNSKECYSNTLKEKVLQQTLNRINVDEANRKSTIRFFNNPFVKVAASIILIIGLGFVFSLFLNKPQKEDGLVTYNEIIVPSGEKTQVILPDGTKIWLNSESKLKYPATFAGKERIVNLEGEGYFDVSKVKGSKFLVKTQGVKIEVLGTIFNVKSYPDEQTVETSVVEGKVKVDASTLGKSIDPVFILPSERAVFYKAQGNFTSGKKIEKAKNTENYNQQKSALIVGEVNIKNVICWKDHLLVFDNETFEEIAVKMARWYKVAVLIDDEGLKKQRFTGKFVNNETYYQVLEAINLTTPIEYKYDKNEIKVTPRYHVILKKKKPKI